MLAKQRYAAEGHIEAPVQYKVYRQYVYLGLPPQRYQTAGPEPPPTPTPPTPTPPAARPFAVRYLSVFEGGTDAGIVYRQKLREAQLIEKNLATLTVVDKLPRATTRVVYAQLALTNLDTTREHTHKIVLSYERLGGDGPPVQLPRTVTIRPADRFFLHLDCTGYAAPGLWKPGRYRVRAMVDGATVSMIFFDIVEGNVAPARPALGPRPLSLPALGVDVETLTEAVRTRHKTNAATGARIVRVHPTSPAARAGMQENETIVFVGSDMIRSAQQLQQRLARERPGAMLKVIVTKPDGFGKTYQAVLGTP